MEKQRLKKQAIREIDLIRDELIELSHLIHKNPEPAFEEYKAMEWLTGRLEENGFDVQKGVAGLPTAFRATLPTSREARPAVALLAEYDALPELGHACGHNIIAAASIGAAIGVSKVVSQLSGTVQVVGTPAEEGGGGKKIMAEKGVFDEVDLAMMVHPSNRTVVARGSLAAKLVEIKFYGKSAHAAAYPERGINALDAVIQTFNNINALREHLRDDARVHGIITHGGVKPNIVPDFGAASFQVRAADGKYLDELLKKVENCARGAALATGARLEFEVSSTGYEAIVVNKAFSDVFADNLRELGVELDELPLRGGMGSTDMGNVSQLLPVIHPYIAICPEEVVGHSPEFAKAAISEAGDNALLVAAKAMAMTTIDVLSDPELLHKIQEEFKTRKDR